MPSAALSTAESVATTSFNSLFEMLVYNEPLGLGVVYVLSFNSLFEMPPGVRATDTPKGTSDVAFQFSI